MIPWYLPNHIEEKLPEKVFKLLIQESSDDNLLDLHLSMSFVDKYEWYTIRYAVMKRKWNKLRFKEFQDFFYNYITRENN